ncbi:MAG: hypothetical protein NZ750_00605 [Anaerolineae bacterium]|nr:hypothetical protein [Anaerolineae bacterium]MDW8173084.1 hypothetical protein [Anaerolineae bacterium]
MLERIRVFFGAGSLRALVFLFIATGLASAFIGASGAEWATAAQTILAFVFILGAVGITLGRLEAEERGKWAAILLPALGLLLLGVLFFPQSLGFFIGGALGWTMIGALIFGRARSPMQYRVAIKAMRKNDYEGAVKAMDDLIKDEPDVPNHYRFRAELLRLWGKLPRARKDYEKMGQVAQDDLARAVAFNGLAELDLQARNYESARNYALRAYELAPQDWVTAYNLGMIEDRLGLWSSVVETLTRKLRVRIPDARHRLLVAFYLWRAYDHLGQQSEAERALAQLRRERDGLREWQILLRSEQAVLLREALADDIEAIGRLIDGGKA